MITDNRTYITDLKDLPEDTVITFGDLETESYFDDKDMITLNDGLTHSGTFDQCPLCEMEKDNIGYDAKHTSPDIGNGVKIKSLCEAEQACKPFSEETGLIAGEGLTLDNSIMFYDPIPSAKIEFVPNNDFCIYGEEGNMLIRIDMSSGDVEYGDNYNPNDACRVFWDCLGQYKQPDAWEENHEITSASVLREVRQILNVGEGEDVLAAVRKAANTTGMIDFTTPTTLSGMGSKVRTLPGGHDNFDNAMKVID